VLATPLLVHVFYSASTNNILTSYDVFISLSPPPVFLFLSFSPIVFSAEYELACFIRHLAMAAV
jgi:hypothetical protein